MMLLDLHGSILRHLMATQSMEDARQGNQETVQLFDGVQQRDGLQDACSEGLDRVKLKLQANVRAIETYGVLIDIAAGALLQISKQAISIAHGKRENAPTGASISSTCVRDLIWHGRNQSMHYEETRLVPVQNGKGKGNSGCSTWVETFQKLNEQNPDRFKMAPPYRSLAKDVLDTLGWTYDYGKFERDMGQLIGITTRLQSTKRRTEFEKKHSRASSSADCGPHQYIEFQPMFNRPPHPTPVWGPFFRAVETTPPSTGLPLPDALAYGQADLKGTRNRVYVVRL